MTGPKLNERPVLRRRPSARPKPVEESGEGARAVARYVRISPYKVREVLDLVRGHTVETAAQILAFSERDAAITVRKTLMSAVANAWTKHTIADDELFVSACFADEGPTLKRWRPRARGRATRIRKRTCHITVVVSRLPEEELQLQRQERQGASAERRRRRTGQSGERRAGRRRAHAAAEEARSAGSAEATPADAPTQTPGPVTETPETGTEPQPSEASTDTEPEQVEPSSTQAEQPTPDEDEE